MQQQQQQQQHHLQQQHHRQQQQCSLTSYTIYIYLSLLSCCLPPSSSFSFTLSPSVAAVGKYSRILRNYCDFYNFAHTLCRICWHAQNVAQAIVVEFVSAAAFNSICMLLLYIYINIWVVYGFMYSFETVLATHLQWVNKCLTRPRAAHFAKRGWHAGRGHCLRKDFMHRHPGCLSMVRQSFWSSAVACIKIDCKSVELHFISIIDFNADFISWCFIFELNFERFNLTCGRF